MKLKQIKLLFAAVIIVAASAVGVVPYGTSGNTVQAYVCGNNSDPAAGDVWEYHESDGKCWKVRYSEAGPAKLDSGTQQLGCPSGQVFHSDDNTCWRENGYTIQDTGTLVPTNNDGTPLAAGNIACTDGFDYITNGKDGPGCYKKNSKGAYECGINQAVNTSASRGGTTDSCGDTKNRIQPKNQEQSSDTTECRSGYVMDADECKPYSDFTNKEDCESRGGQFKLTDAKGAGGDDDVWTCTPPANQEQDACAGLSGGELKACQAGKNGEDCNEMGTDAEKAACEAGRKQAGEDGTGKNCGQAETVLITCSGSGVGAIGDILRIVITVLSVLIGVAAVGGLAWASVIYAKAEDSEGNTKEAKELIRNIVIGLLLYGFMVAIINWLVPGGVIG